MLRIGDKTINSRLFMGSAGYPNLDVMCAAFRAGQTEVVTLGLRRANIDGSTDNRFVETLASLNLNLLPNTAGCRTVKEAVTMAKMCRQLLQTNWIKLELIGDDYTLQPDTELLVQAAKILIEDGFEVFPYTNDDLITAQKLVDVGCNIVMPWGSPIGSGRGLMNPYALELLRHRLSDTILVVDAGLRSPSDAAMAMELGFDAVLTNTAIADAQDPVMMAQAFAGAVRAGFDGHRAGLMEKREMAKASTSLLGMPFWHGEEPES